MASHLCKWAIFIDNLDDEKKQILLTIAPFSDEAHNSYELLKCLARLSEESPFEANEVWQAMLVGSSPDYPEEAIKTLLSNVASVNKDGLRAAKSTVSKYLEKGKLQPSTWLSEIIQSQNSSDSND